jgi:hypothetical protein
MCIFSAPVKTVAGTAIIVGKTINGTIRLVYSNKVACDNGNVMVLPINSDLVSLVELNKKYESLGQNISDNYQKYLNYLNQSHSKSMSSGRSYTNSNIIEVIKYGPYDVSLTKQLDKVNWDHFGGLANKDAFYKLLYSKYPNHNFLIAKIRPTQQSDSNDDKLPICFEFISKTNHVMMPTYHIHDGTPESKPDWDHYLLILNGKISNFDPDVLKDNFQSYFTSNISSVSRGNLIVPKDDFESFFYSTYNLFHDEQFNNNPYENIQYINLIRIKPFADMPNIDIECKFDSTIDNTNIKQDNELFSTEVAAVVLPSNPISITMYDSNNNNIKKIHKLKKEIDNQDYGFYIFIILLLVMALLFYFRANIL